MSTYRSPKEIAVTIREALKKELPSWKFSVTVKNYDSITVALMSGPKPVTVDGKGYAQLNHYTLLDGSSFRPDRLNNGCYLTHVGWDVMRKAAEILSREHWDKSEIQIDYFCCNFYRHLDIGKWDKWYQVK